MYIFHSIFRKRNQTAAPGTQWHVGPTYSQTKLDSSPFRKLTGTAGPQLGPGDAPLPPDKQAAEPGGDTAASQAE